MRENTDQKNSEYGHFLRSVKNKIKAWQEAFHPANVTWKNLQAEWVSFPNFFINLP